MVRYTIGYVDSSEYLHAIEPKFPLNKRKIGGVATYFQILVRTIVERFSSRFYLKLGALDGIKYAKMDKNYMIEVERCSEPSPRILSDPYVHFLYPIKIALLATRISKDVDIFHLNNFAEGGLIKFFVPDIKVIYTIHGAILPRNTLYNFSLYYHIVDQVIYLRMKNAIKHSDGIISVGKGMDPELYFLIKKYQKRLFIVPNGVDVDKFSPEIKGEKIREKYSIPEEGIVIISTSRFSYQRRVEMLIKVFRKLSKKYKNLYLLLVGAGPREMELKALVQRLGIKRNVVFTGPVPHTKIPFYYAAADIAFNSFTDEPSVDLFIYDISLKKAVLDFLPLSKDFVTLESLASGLPLVGVVKQVRKYKSINIKKLRDDSGIVVPKGDLNMLEKAIELLIKFPELRENMGKNARELILRERNIKDMIGKTLKIYEDILQS